MKTLVIVPSKRRSNVFQENVLPWLSLMRGFDWRVFVEPQDADEYASLTENITILPENDKGLGYSLAFIRHYAKDNGYDAVFKCDDDVRGFTDFRKKLTPEESARKFEEIIGKNEKLMEQFTMLGAIGFPYSFQMFTEFEYRPTKRLQTCYHIRTEVWHPRWEISVFEDFAAGIKVLAEGYRLLVYGMSGIVLGIDVGKGEGGHQCFDRKEKAEKEIPFLREIYPPLRFKKVDKAWGIEPDLRSVDL